MIKENQTFTITENDAKRRIDRILRKFLPALPMSALYSALRLGKIKVNGKKVKPSYIAEKNDILEIVNLAIEDRGIKPSAQINMQIEDTEKKTIFKSAKPEILLKTEDLIFINKPKGQIVHGEKSLCEAVLQYFPSQIQSLSFTPGPLHRLDKNTSGIITFSQSLDGARQFSKALQEGKTGKYYIGITEGTKVKSVFKNTIDGKLCICYTKTLEISKKYNMSLVLFELITGKKHQIRIQCNHFKTPLLNDKKYGSKFSFKNTKNYFLHAYKLEFKEKILKNLPNAITAPLPNDFSKIIKDIFKINNLAEKL